MFKRVVNTSLENLINVNNFNPSERATFAVSPDNSECYMLRFNHKYKCFKWENTDPTGEMFDSSYYEYVNRAVNDAIKKGFDVFTMDKREFIIKNFR